MKKELDLRSEILKLKTGFNPKEVAEKFGVETRQITDILDCLMAEGYLFVNNDGAFIRSKVAKVDNAFDASRLFRDGLLHFALVGDKHLGAKAERLDALNAFYDRCQREGIKVIFGLGDVTTGENVYKGQVYENKVQGQEEQIDYVIKNYPKRDGIITVTIGGNHDLRAFEHGGCDPLVQIARARKDIKYIGQYDATVKLHQEVNMRLTHPASGPAYALSYKAQRMINNLSPDNIPNVWAHGHFHTAFYMHYRGIDFVQVPCFKDQDNFESRLGLNPTIGGWLIEGVSNGEVIHNFKPDLITYPNKRK